jgi:hypothetical protein
MLPTRWPPKAHAPCRRASTAATATSRTCRAARKVFFPVYVDGAGLSVGDLHFSQGDGEITFCGAIEMAGWVHMRVSLIKGGMAKYGIKNPIFKPSPITPNYNDYLIFEGISVDEQGKQHYLDVTVAYRQACLNAIEYLKKFGYSRRPGLLHPRHRAGAGPHQRRGRRAQRLRHAVAADARSSTSTSTRRRPAGEVHRRQRADADLARQEVSPRSPACPPMTTPVRPAAASRRCAACRSAMSPQPARTVARLHGVFVAAPRLACLSSETRRATRPTSVRVMRRGSRMTTAAASPGRLRLLLDGQAHGDRDGAERQRRPFRASGPG